jgi:AraC-like DNA-binding protein
MLFEPTTIASAARVIAETLDEEYGEDSVSILRQIGMDPELLAVPGARYPWKSMQRLWQKGADVTGDPCFGLRVGRRIRPTSFHAIGYSWLASDNLLDALERLCRYSRVISTAPVSLTLETGKKQCALVEQLENENRGSMYVSIDAFIAAVLELCRAATNRHFKPASVTLTHANFDHVDEYVKAFDAPVTFEASRNAIFFEMADLKRPLPGNNADLALANDKVAEQYLASLDPQTVATEVRELLMDLLSSGHANQTDIAKRLNRSLSTLQRQLTTEGTSYQTIRDDTRRQLAENYVRESRLSLSEIAYLLGFSDQSNFSRAFKRWTGEAPRDFRN